MTNDQLAAISKDVAVMLWDAPNSKLSRGDKWRWAAKDQKPIESHQSKHNFEPFTNMFTGGGAMTQSNLLNQWTRTPKSNDAVA